MTLANTGGARFPLSDEIIRQARWIWPEYLSHRLYNGYALFRREFEVAAVPERAWAVVTADQSYHLYLNGQFVCRGPARGYQRNWPADEVDLAPFLRPGKNLIAIRAYNPGCSSFQYRTEDYAGVFFAAEIGPDRLVSDRAWRSRRQAGVRCDTEPSSLQLFPQEHIDLRVEPAEWACASFDDSGWAPPSASTAWNSPPWSNLEPRGIPLLSEEVIPIGGPCAEGEGPCAPGWREARDVFGLRFQEGFHLAPVGGGEGGTAVQATGAERYRTLLFDLGKTHVGSLDVEAEGTTSGDVVDFAYAETVDPATLAPLFADQEVRLGSRLICRDGTSSHLFFHPYGYRYLVVTVRGAVRPLRLRMRLRSAVYPLDVRGNFGHSDPGMRRIWDACAWTQRICCLDAYVDTPWREQAQWWGDARVQAWNTFHLAADARLLRRGIRVLAGQMTDTGLTYGHAPTKAHHCVVPDFSLIWILTLWDYYWQTGDPSLIREFEGPLRRILAYFREQTHPEWGLVAHDARYWLFLDWADLYKGAYPTILSLWLILALQKVEALAEAANVSALWQDIGPWREFLSRGVLRLEDENGIGNGRDADGRPVPGTSIHAQTLFVDAGLRPDRAGEIVHRSLLPLVEGRVERAGWPSIYWLAYVFRCLIRHGHGEAAVRFIRGPWHPGTPRECDSAWSIMARHGSTWSQFGVYGGRHSHSHAWSAHPLFHLMETIGGIVQAGVAWERIEYRPVFLGEWADVSVPTPKGMIRSRWDGKRVRLDLPRGITARVLLPGRPAEEISGSVEWAVPLSSPCRTGEELPCLVAER